MEPRLHCKRKYGKCDMYIGRRTMIQKKVVDFEAMQLVRCHIRQGIGGMAELMP